MPISSGLIKTPFLDQDGNVSHPWLIFLKAVSEPVIKYTQSGAGAVARNITDRLREEISVKDFGAVGDGVTDDTAAIQAAVTALGSGGTLVLPRPAVAYRLTRTLSFSHVNSIRMQGVGSRGGDDNLSVLRWDGPANGIPLLLDCVRDSQFESFAILPGTGSISIGISIDQIAPSGSALSANNKFQRVLIGASTTGIQIGNLQSVSANNSEHVFEDVYIQNAGTYGIYVKYSQSRNISIERGSITNRTYGIYHNDGASRIRGVNFGSNTGSDIYFANSNDTISIIGCHSEGSAMFLDGGGPSGANYAAILIGNSFVVGGSTGSLILRYRFAGPFVMTGNDFSGGDYNAALFDLGANVGAVVTSEGNVFPNGSVFTGNTHPIVLTSIGDRSIDNTSTPQRMPNAIGAPLQFPSFTFATLPTASAGMLAIVTDSNTNTWGAVIAAGGANTVLAFYNGSNWTVAGK